MLVLLACTDDPERATPAGPASDDVWDADYVPEYRLTIAEADWEAALWALHESDTCEDRPYMPASLEYDNPRTQTTESYPNVGVRYRGHSALDPESGNRYGVKVSFDEYDTEQEFHGLHHINFMGTEGDFSLVRERLAQGVMRAAGVPAPRVTHVLLYVNDEFYGVMPFPEEQDDGPYVDAHFEDDEGALFKVNGYCAGSGDFVYRDDEVGSYDGRYEAKAGTPESAYEELLIPFIDCADDYTPDAFDTDSDVAMESCIEEWIDVDEWLAEMAVDVAVLDVDGMQGTAQNYMLYFDPSIARFVVYPWDKDSTFRAANAESPGDDSIWRTYPFWAAESGRLPPAFPEDLRVWRKEEYCATVLEVAELCAPDALGAELDALDSLLSGFIEEDTFIAVEHDWGWQMSSLREEIAARYAQVVGEAEACAPP
jgi:spore coat protein CotH